MQDCVHFILEFKNFKKVHEKLNLKRTSPWQPKDVSGVLKNLFARVFCEHTPHLLQGICFQVKVL